MLRAFSMQSIGTTVNALVMMKNIRTIFYWLGWAWQIPSFCWEIVETLPGSVDWNTVKCRTKPYTYSKPEMGDHCVVDLFADYLSLVLQNGPFYRHPIKNSTPPNFLSSALDTKHCQPLPIAFMKKLGLLETTRITVVKVTCATILFHSGVDKELIKKQTGYHSDAVRAYKRSFPEQDATVSSILQPPEPKKPQP